MHCGIMDACCLLLSTFVMSLLIKAKSLGYSLITCCFRNLLDRWLTCIRKATIGDFASFHFSFLSPMWQQQLMLDILNFCGKQIHCTRGTHRKQLAAGRLMGTTTLGKWNSKKQKQLHLTRALARQCIRRVQQPNSLRYIIPVNLPTAHCKYDH